MAQWARQWGTGVDTVKGMEHCGAALSGHSQPHMLQSEEGELFRGASHGSLGDVELRKVLHGQQQEIAFRTVSHDALQKLLNFMKLPTTPGKGWHIS